MATIVNFADASHSRPASKARNVDDGGAQILLFTGVRYERTSEAIGEHVNANSTAAAASRRD